MTYIPPPPLTPMWVKVGKTVLNMSNRFAKQNFDDKVKIGSEPRLTSRGWEGFSDSYWNEPRPPCRGVHRLSTKPIASSDPIHKKTPQKKVGKTVLNMSNRFAKQNFDTNVKIGREPRLTSRGWEGLHDSYQNEPRPPCRGLHRLSVKVVCLFKS